MFAGLPDSIALASAISFSLAISSADTPSAEIATGLNAATCIAIPLPVAASPV